MTTTPFIFKALGFELPYNGSRRGVQPSPFPYESYIGYTWDTTHLMNADYKLVFMADNAPPWDSNRTRFRKSYVYPPRDDGVFELWSFKNFRYMSGCSDKVTKTAYRQLVNGEENWLQLDEIISEKCDNGSLEPDVREEWQTLRRPFLKRTRAFYWERKCINDAVLLALAIDCRWGFLGVNGESTCYTMQLQ